MSRTDRRIACDVARRWNVLRRTRGIGRCEGFHPRLAPLRRGSFLNLHDVAAGRPLSDVDRWALAFRVIDYRPDGTDRFRTVAIEPHP